MPLSDISIKQAKYGGLNKAGDKHTDSGGLYLLITAAGKYWRLNYRYLGKQTTLSLGVYPAVSLQAARKARDDARAHLANGIDPNEQKKNLAKEAERIASDIFEVAAREWMTNTASERSPKTHKRVVSWFERDVFPFIGQQPVSGLRPRDILDVMKHMQARGVVESAHRVLGYISKVFRMAMVAER